MDQGEGEEPQRRDRAERPKFSAQKSPKTDGRENGQNAPVARPRLLTPPLADAIVQAAELGLRLPVSERSLRRWRQEGRGELDALSPEARLVLALDAAEERRRVLDWRASA